VRPEAFFSGPGLDRADALRASPQRIAELATRPDARELVWLDGIPATDERGNLCWQEVTDASLFLGLKGQAPRFSGLAKPATQAVRVSCTCAALVCRSRAISGKAGRYMSIESGPIALTSPSTTTSLSGALVTAYT